jgi:hypothetical protein
MEPSWVAIIMAIRVVEAHGRGVAQKDRWSDESTGRQPHNRLDGSDTRGRLR